VKKQLRKQFKAPEKTLASVIPPFFVPKERSNELKQKMRKEARTRFLERKAEQLLDELELEHLWEVTLDNVVDTSEGEARDRLNYDAFCHIGSEMPEKAHAFFAPKVFLKFPRDAVGRISAKALFHYIVRKVSMMQLRISLTCYDEMCEGYLREQDLENYVFEQISGNEFTQLQTLDEDFYPYYVFTAVRKFFFFLDPMKKGKISIKDAIASPILHEFNLLRQPASDATPGGWFTSRAALKVYGTYLNLDYDHNGMLSAKEFVRYNVGSLTDVFVERLFQEYKMYESESGEMEMDYKTFLDFMLAMEYRDTKQSIQYFWKVLDIHNCGYLTSMNLNYFFRAVQKKLIDFGHEPVDVGDVVNEIFDMVKPRNALRITMKDLIDCEVGHTVISILIDLNGFWKYDNREQIQVNQN
jgi:Ca2+-binding EF-hand superfamily protein